MIATEVGIRCHGSQYYLELLEPGKHTESGLTLPDDYVDAPTDGVVLAAGPGQTLPSGAAWPMQAQVGDRVIYEKNSYHGYDGRRGFVHDGRLVALIPGPGHTQLLPANDWVLVQPDALKAVEPVTGAYVEIPEEDQKVLVALGSLLGGEQRIRQEAELAYRELRSLEQTERFQDADPYDRERMIHNYLDNVSSDVRRELDKVFLDAHNSKRRTYRAPLVRRGATNHGEVLAVGPGRVVDSSDYCTGRTRTRCWEGPFWGSSEIPVELTVGSRVWWDPGPQVRMAAGVLVKASWLCAVLAE